MLARRTFLTGIIAAVAAPAIVRVSSIMPIKAAQPILTLEDWMRMCGPLIQRTNQAIVDAIIHGSASVEYAPGYAETIFSPLLTPRQIYFPEKRRGLARYLTDREKV